MAFLEKTLASIDVQLERLAPSLHAPVEEARTVARLRMDYLLDLRLDVSSSEQ